MRTLLFVALVAGCGSDVATVAAPSFEPPLPDDTAEPEHTDEEPVSVPLVCGEAVADGLDPLAVDWCARVSPEPDQVYPRADEHDEHGDTDEIDDEPEGLPRCGFFNSIGAVGLSDKLDGAALYCDSDALGGLRFATWDAASGTARRTMLANAQCVAEADSGALGARPEGWIAAWMAVGDDAMPVLRTMPLSSAGEAAGPVHEVDVDMPGAVAFAGDALFAIDGEQRVRAWRIGDDGAPIGSPAQLANEGRAIAAARTPDGGGAVAVCSVHGFLSLVRFGPDLQPTSTDSTPWMCAGQLDVSLALAPDGTAAIAWADLDAYRFALRTPSGGGDRIGLPQLGAAAWAGDGWLLATADGHVAKLDPHGQKVAEAFHPAVLAASVESKGLRVATDGQRATFLLVGSDLITVGDHLWSYNFLELSSGAVP